MAVPSRSTIRSTRRLERDRLKHTSGRMDVGGTLRPAILFGDQILDGRRWDSAFHML
jgi:hypothetical protein